MEYVPTGEQALLMARLAKFTFEMQGRDIFLLKGYAGTGKSSLVGAFVKTLAQFRLRTVLMAPTGRAAKVFGQYASAPAFTIHKKIYRQKGFSPDMAGFSLTDNRYRNTLFIVDEASMIADSSNDSVSCGSGSLLDDLLEFVYSAPGCRLVLIGDSAQLPPVGKAESPALDEAALTARGFSVSGMELEGVVRQGLDSGILYNATMIRNKIGVFPAPMPDIRLKGFTDIRVVSGESLIEELDSAYSRDGIEETVIITRSNKRANIFNDGVRNRLLYREEELTSGDLLLIARNNYFWGEESEGVDFIANGDTARVVRVNRYESMYGFRFADVSLHLVDYDTEIDAKIILDTLHADSPSLTPEMNSMLFSRVMDDYADIRLKRERLKRVKCDVWYNALQVKYAYAVTCHKAQGGQWKNVFLDMGNISADSLGTEFYRWLYTAFTRATERLFIINLPKEFVDSDQREILY